MNKINTYRRFDIPDPLTVTVTVLCLIMTLSPYLSNADFGIFKVPDFQPNVKSILQWIGPLTLLFAIGMFIPLHKRTMSEDKFKSDIESISELGYQLRYFSTLQVFGMKSNDNDLKKIVTHTNLKIHSKEIGDELIKHYYEQLNDPKEMDAFNIGFYFAQIEVGLMIISKKDIEKSLKDFVESGIFAAKIDLKVLLTKFGIEEIANLLDSKLDQEGVQLYRAKVMNKLRNKTAHNK